MNAELVGFLVLADVQLGLHDVAAGLGLDLPHIALGDLHPVFIGVLSRLDHGFHLLAGLERGGDHGVGLGRVVLEQLVQTWLGTLQDVQGERGDPRAHCIGHLRSELGEPIHQRLPGLANVELAAGIVQPQVARQAQVGGDLAAIGRAAARCAATHAVVQRRVGYRLRLDRNGAEAQRDHARRNGQSPLQDG